MMKHVFLFFLINLYAFLCVAQPFSFTRLGIEDGLPNSYVQSIVQDGKGNIWLATENGLSRFDGNRFTVYNRHNSSLPDNILQSLYYDKRDNCLWIGGKGISILDLTTYRMKTYKTFQDKKILLVYNFQPATDGGLWISASGTGILHYDREKQKFSTLAQQGENLPSSTTLCTFDDGQGHLYIGYGQDGLCKIDLKSRAIKNFKHQPGNPNSIPGNSVYKICRDHKNRIWLGTNRGLALFHPDTQTFTSFKADRKDPQSLISDHIYDIREINNMLWIATDIGGVSLLDPDAVTMQTLPKAIFTNISADGTEKGLSSKNIRALMQDSFGNIWIANYGSGLDIISHLPPAFRVLPDFTSRGNINRYKPVWGMLHDSNGNLWAGGENELRLFRDNRFVQSYDLTPYLFRMYAQVFCIAECGNGELLLGMFDDGLLRFDVETGNIQRIPMEKPHIDINVFFKDKDGKIWIGTENGLYTYKGHALYKENEINRKLKSHYIQGLLRDREGKLWVGTGGGGISIFDDSKQYVMTVAGRKDTAVNIINDLFLDSEGRVWAATCNGVACFKDTKEPASYQVYNEEQNLNDIYIRAIGEDKTGTIWVSTNNELNGWDAKHQTFRCYSYKDGLPSGNFIRGASCTTPDGKIYFSSLKGVCYFNPQDLFSRDKPSPVQLVDCIVPKDEAKGQHSDIRKPVAPKGIELSYDENSFSLSFSVADYAQRNDMEYAYVMKGLDDKWVNISNENEVAFRNIPPGNYIFKVKARSKNQNWEEAQYAALPIRIRPPFYLSGYAKLSYILLGLFLLFMGIRIYNRRLQLKNSLLLEQKRRRDEQELNNERLRFFTNISHELRTPLTLIIGPLEDLIYDRQFPEAYQRTIQLVHGSASRLLNLINDLLEFRKTETQNRRLTVIQGDLRSCVAETGLRYKELNRNEQVKFDIHLPDFPIILYFDAEVITTILNNLLSNAMKYTPTGTISLTISEKDDGRIPYVEILVEDTGYGIDSESLPHIFDRYYQAQGKHQASGTGIGLALVKTLAELHRATLSVSSIPGQGSKFVLRLRRDETYPEIARRDILSQQPADRDTILASAASEVGADEPRPTLLVVEDNADIRSYIVSALHTQFNMIEATNGQEGWTQAQIHIPDLIISDIMMPVMNGIELCRNIKGDIRTSHIPVILLTAKDTLSDKEEGYDNGADSYLTKPFSTKLLCSRIVNLLKSRSQLASLALQRAKALTALHKKQSTEDVPAKSSPLSDKYPRPENENSKTTGNKKPALTKMDELFLTKITRLIQDNLLNDRLDTNFLSEKMHMSDSTLYRKIKALTGVSRNEFIRKIRLQHAFRLLTEEGYNVSEAAYGSGFSDMNHFRICFKEEFGKSPSNYKR